MSTLAPPPKKPNARDGILDAALRVIREKGYGATSVDDLCQTAGVTKGAFFHHFKSKEALGVAAARHWSDTIAPKFARAPYHNPADPLDRVLAYLDFRRGLIRGPASEFSCVAGTMVQETHQSSPMIRDACYEAITEHAQTLEADIAAAIAKYGIAIETTAASLALYSQTVLQGAFIVAKAKNDPQVAIDSIDHLRAYFEMLFNTPDHKETLS